MLKKVDRQKNNTNRLYVFFVIFMTIKTLLGLAALIVFDIMFYIPKQQIIDLAFWSNITLIFSSITFGYWFIILYPRVVFLENKEFLQRSKLPKIFKRILISLFDSPENPIFIIGISTAIWFIIIRTILVFI